MTPGEAGQALVVLILIGVPMWIIMERVRRDRRPKQPTIEQEQEERQEMASHAPVWRMGKLREE